MSECESCGSPYCEGLECMEPDYTNPDLGVGDDSEVSSSAYKQ